MKLTIAKNPHFQTQVTFVSQDDTVNRVVDFEAGKNTVTVRYEGKKAVIYCGMGKKSECSSATVRSAAASGIRQALTLKRSEVSIIEPSQKEFRGAAVEGALLASYSFDKYKKDKATLLDALELVGEGIDKNALRRIVAICENVTFCRDLINENAHIANPEFLATQAKKIAKAGKMAISVLTEKDLVKKGLGLLFAVGQGSPFPPRLVVVEYKGNPSSKEKTAIIGKGITFDSGGQNLKPTGSIETMREDMAGAAAVLATMKALAELKPKINVVGVCALAHNAIGENAFFPGDVYKAYNGTTVEITSTDAEGRLVLADAIAYCKDIYNPARIIDLATLTGGVIVSLGSVVAGLFANDDKLAASLWNAGEKVQERLWRFPLYEEYGETLKSDIADMRNTSTHKKGWASSITGAAFIHAFAGATPWAHLDIAGTAFREEAAKAELPNGATGFGVRLLLNFFGIE